MIPPRTPSKRPQWGQPYVSWPQRPHTRMSPPRPDEPLTTHARCATKKLKKNKNKSIRSAKRARFPPQKREKIAAKSLLALRSLRSLRALVAGARLILAPVGGMSDLSGSSFVRFVLVVRFVWSVRFARLASFVRFVLFGRNDLFPILGTRKSPPRHRKLFSGGEVGFNSSAPPWLGTLAASHERDDESERDTCTCQTENHFRPAHCVMPSAIPASTTSAAVTASIIIVSPCVSQRPACSRVHRR